MPPSYFGIRFMPHSHGRSRFLPAAADPRRQAPASWQRHPHGARRGDAVCRPQVRADRSAGDLLNQVGPPGPCPIGFTSAQRNLGALDDEALRLGDQVYPWLRSRRAIPCAAPPAIRASPRVSNAAALLPLAAFGKSANQSRTPGPSAPGSISCCSTSSFFSSAESPILRLRPEVMPRMWVGPPTTSRSAALTSSWSASATRTQATSAVGSAVRAPSAIASATSRVLPNKPSNKTTICMNPALAVAAELARCDLPAFDTLSVARLTGSTAGDDDAEDR